MMHWFEVFLYEARQQFRRKAYLSVTFGLPVLALVIFFGYRAYRDTTQKSTSESQKPITETANQNKTVIGYVDLTPQHLFPDPGSYASVACTPTAQEAQALTLTSASSTLVRSELIKRISSPYCLRQLVLSFDTRAEGDKALDNGRIDALYVVEPDFAQKGDVSVYIRGFNLSISSTAQTLMQDYLLRSLLYNVDAKDYESLYLRLRDPAFLTQHKITATGATQQENQNQKFILVYGFGLLMMLSVFWGGGYLMQSVVQEKESRIIEIILSSVRPTPLLLGKILAMGMLSLLQVGMLAGAFTIILSQAGNLSEALGNVHISAGTLAVMVVYFLLGFLFFGSLMAAIGALTTSVRESQNLVAVVTLPAAVPYFFLTVFAQDPNGSLAVILSLFPLTAPLSMVMRLSAASVPLLQLAIGIALLALAVAFAIWLAGRVFRVNVLLMGNMPRLRDIPKLIRG
jgi:ABC-2 type transport system permease protein